MKKKELTVENLKLMLLALVKMQQSEQVKLQERIQKALGNKMQTERPAAIVIRNKIADLVSDILARRLKMRRRSTPLVSLRDFGRLIPSILETIEQVEGFSLGGKKRKNFEKSIRATIKNSLEMAFEFMWSYDEYWRWIGIVINLASERGISPIEFLARKDANGEVMRRLFPRGKLVALYKRAIHKFMSVDTMKKIVIQPMLEMLTIDNEEDLREMEREFEAEFMPQLKVVVKKSKEVLKVWLNEEIARIYASA